MGLRVFLCLPRACLPRLVARGLRLTESRLPCSVHTRARPEALGFRRSSGHPLRDRFQFGSCKPLGQLYQHRRTSGGQILRGLFARTAWSVLARERNKVRDLAEWRRTWGRRRGAYEEPSEAAGAIDGEELE